MQVTARLNNFRMSAKKARLMADLVRGKNTAEAKSQLRYAPGKMAQPLLKLLDSGVANAANNFGLDKNNLYIERIIVNEGTVMKRYRPRAHGRAYEILKRSCHVELTLNEVVEGRGRTTVEKQEVATVSYEELKKATKEAEEILEKQKSSAKKGKQGQKKEEAKKTGTTEKGGALGKIFRRKSI